MAEADIFIAESEDDPSTEPEEEKEEEKEAEEEQPVEEAEEPVDHPAAENQEEPGDEYGLCPSCENSPCEFIQAQEELERVVSIMDPQATMKAKRFHTYRFLTRRIHGQLGKNERIPLPPCCVQGIADLFPADDGVYVGFRQAPGRD
jgi:hypothetical protein